MTFRYKCGHFEQIVIFFQLKGKRKNNKQRIWGSVTFSIAQLSKPPVPQFISNRFYLKCLLNMGPEDKDNAKCLGWLQN